MEEQKIKYVVNVVFQRPYVTEDNQVHSITDTTSLIFDKYKDARKSYKDISRSHVLEQATAAGTISYRADSVEFVDIAKLEEYREKQAEEAAKQQEENGTGNTEQPGTDTTNGTVSDDNTSSESTVENIDASDASTNESTESQADEEVFEQEDEPESEEAREHSQAGEAS